VEKKNYLLSLNLTKDNLVTTYMNAKISSDKIISCNMVSMIWNAFHEMELKVVFLVSDKQAWLQHFY
jgi:hypothetical protein